MGLLTAVGASDALYLPYLNTGTMVDVITGAFVPGTDNHRILNGGLAATNGVMGKPQVFKSTLANGLIVNVLARYPRSECYINDTEFSLGNKQRILGMVNLHQDDQTQRELLLKEMEDRLIITNPTEHDLETFIEVVKKIAEEKFKHKKDYTVQIPLLDRHTGKPQQMFVPTFVGIDSWSKGRVRSALEVLEKNLASSSDTNTVFMKEGLAKTKIMGLIPTLAVKAGIYFTLTAHVGDKIDMSGGYGPPAKDLQYMKQGEKAKGVGSDFMFLVSNLIEARSASVLVDADKECEYPLVTGITAPNEMSSVTMILTRCKNNNAGAQFTPVMSQSNGLETALTDYHYLRKNDYFGLSGNKQHHQPKLYPDVTLSRRTATTKLMDYKTARAVELLAQLCYVQHSWTMRDETAPFSMTPEELTDALVARSGYAMDDILNSRGWWTYGEHPRSYLSLFDVLDIASGKYKPKLISMSGSATSKKK